MIDKKTRNKFNKWVKKQWPPERIGEYRVNTLLLAQQAAWEAFKLGLELGQRAKSKEQSQRIEEGLKR